MLKILVLVLLASFPMVARAQQQAARKPPNILVIRGDDIGQLNVSAYNMGMMGYKTPNIDRIAREGALFTDWYGQQSCTAGRAAFIHSLANADGTQRVTDTGPLTRKRMETIDEEVNAKALDFMDRAVKEGKPFFLWWNSTRMHIWTHLKPESEGKTGLGIYPGGMVELDGHVGLVLDKLKALGIEDNTFVMYSTDNGAETMSWPDRGTSIFRGEKNTNWEGGYRVPCAIRWPGVVKPGTIINDIGSHEDMLPTRVAKAGDASVIADLKKGRTIGTRSYKVHIDGYDLGPALRGESPWPRREFIYWTDDGSVAALRYDQWKVVFLEQRGHGFDVGQEPFVARRLPKRFNLRTDPFERADHEGMGYAQWRIDRAFLIAPAGAFVGQWLQSFREFPPRQKPGSFNRDNVMETVTNPGNPQ